MQLLSKKLLGSQYHSKFRLQLHSHVISDFQIAFNDYYDLLVTFIKMPDKMKIQIKLH